MVWPILGFSQVTVQRFTGLPPGGTSIGDEVVIVQNVNELVNEVIEFKPAEISSEGVDLINGMLEEYLAAVQARVNPSNMTIKYHVTGQSFPQGIATNFRWELKIDISIVGKVKVDVIG